MHPAVDEHERQVHIVAGERLFGDRTFGVGEQCAQFAFEVFESARVRRFVLLQQGGDTLGCEVPMRFAIALTLTLCFMFTSSSYGTVSDEVRRQFKQGMDALRYQASSLEEQEDKLDEAIALFKAILDDNPSLHRVRLELAHAYFQKHEDSNAMSEFEKVLADDNLPENVIANVQTFLHRIKQRRSWSLDFSVAKIFNTNRSRHSNDELGCLLGACVFLSNEKPDPGFGANVRLSGAHQIPLTRRMVWRNMATVDSTDYANKPNDRVLFSLRTGPALLLDPATELSLFGIYQRTEEGVYNNMTSVELQLAHRLSYAVKSAASLYTQDNRNEVGINDNGVKGYNVWFDWNVEPTINVHASFGSDRRTFVDYETITNRFTFGGSTILNYGFVVRATVSLERSKSIDSYLQIFSRDGKVNTDMKRFEVTVKNHSWDIRGFTPELSVSRSLQLSSIPTDKYKQYQVGLRFSYGF